MDKAIVTILEAISFAARRHRDQVRKDRKTPYAAHPMRVLFILRDLFGIDDREVLAAAALHDTIEDTATDRDDITERFGKTVAGYVADLTKDKRLPEEERERRYREQLNEASVPVKLCKLADTLDNLIDAAGLSAGARRKAAGKAAQLLASFEPDLQKDYPHVLELVRSRLGELETSP